MAAEKPATAQIEHWVGLVGIGLSTRDYIMRSPQTLLAPLLALTLVSATFLTLNAAVRTRITRAVAFAAEIAVPGVSRVKRISRVIQASRISGSALLAVGVVMLYGLVTPLLIGVGAAVVAYASHILSLLRRRPRNQRRPAGQENGMASPAYEETGGALPRGQTFHYRYRGLRLLIMGQGRMFLVPAQWDPSDSALIVPLDGSVHVQLQFEKQPP